jgi:hypothetical protein
MAKKAESADMDLLQRNADYIRAGAFLPPGSPLPADEPVDTLEARIYRHPALGDRPVVRLCLSSLGAGSDATMGVIGFGAPEVKGGLGIGKRQALGFPEAVLVSAPEHAPLTLKLVKFLKKTDKQMRNSPGNAKVAIEAEARSADAAPVILCSFYEEVGRMFVEAGNMTYAATFFGKARDVERTYALDVDEGRRRDAFVEFALSGALTNKVMTEYARDLITRHGEAIAYDYFYDLCVRRTLGGSPPSSEMVKQLRRMIKGAGLKQQDEDNRFIEAVWESPSLAKAAPAFWEIYADTFVAFAKTRPEVANHLLHLFPEPTQGKRHEFYVLWLDILERAGLLAAALDHPAPKDSKIVMEKGSAAWLEQLMGRMGKGRYYWNYSPIHESFFGILKRAAARIKAEDKPIQLVSRQGWYTYADPDLLDYALELGLKLADPPQNTQMNLSVWADTSHHNTYRPRDFALLAADKRFEPIILAAVGGVIGEEAFEACARGKKALREARERWLTDQIEHTRKQGLPDAESHFYHVVHNKISASMMAEFPHVYARLKTLDFAPALLQTLNNGLFSELHWPALSEAIAKLRGLKKDHQVKIAGSFPHVILFNDVRAIVVGPDGIVLEHDIKKPDKHDIPKTMRYANGHLLVIFGTSRKAYWSNKPNDVLEVEGYYWDYDMAYSAQLADGASTEGGPVLRVGDLKFHQAERAFYDGTTFWKQVWDNNESKLREYDPRQNSFGRFSLPAWFEETAKPGWRAMFENSMLFAIDGLKDSPLGAKDGKVGYILRTPIIEPPPGAEKKTSEDEDESYDDDTPATQTEYELMRIDGATWRGSLANHSSSFFAMRFPGDDTLRPVSMDYVTRLWTPDGKHTTATVGTRTYHSSESPYADWTKDIMLPVQCWHALRPRDEEGSRALRKLTAEQLAPIFAIALAESAEAKKNAVDPKHCQKTVQAIAKGIPAIKDAGLRDAVARVILQAANLQNTLLRAVKDNDPASFKSEEVNEYTFSIRDFQELATLVDGGYRYNYNNGMPYHPVITAAEHFLLTGEQSSQVEALGPAGWLQHLPNLSAMARLGFTFGCAGDRPRIARQLRYWSKRDMFAHPERYRILVCEGTRGSGNVDEDEDDVRVQFTHNKSRYYGFFKPEEWGSKKGTYTLVEYNEAGAFEEPPKRKLVSSKPLTELDLTGERLAALATALETYADPEVWDARIGEVLAKLTGLTSAEASLLWIGLPNISHWGSNFLPKESRSFLNIKAKEAEVARGVFRNGERNKIIAALSRSLPADLSTFAAPLGAGEDDKQSPVALLAAAWNEAMGKRESLDEALVLDLQNEVYTSIDAKTFIKAMMEVDKATLLHVYPKHKFDAEGNYVCDGEAPSYPIFGPNIIYTLIHVTPYLIATRPPEHPVRRALPKAIDACVEMLKNENFLFCYNTKSFWGDHADRKRKDMMRLVGGKESKKPHMFDNGRLVAVEQHNYVCMYMRPAKIARCMDEPLLKEFALKEGDEPNFPNHIQSLDIIRSAEFRAMAQRAVETPVAEGGDERDPRQSVPALLKEVQETHDLSEDAAVLYLVLLGWPTFKEKELRDFFGWSPKVYKAACAELVAKELALEAKRERAGRTIFLPGRWEALKSPLPSVEAWKIPLHAGFNIDHTGKPNGRHFTWKYPPHMTFEKAWARIKAGDKPSF